MESSYRLRYLPLFYEDASEVVSYIRDVLQNQAAAKRLIDDVEKAILDRLPSAESFMEYQSEKERSNPYYTIRVRNFTVFYVVLHEGESKVMEVRRLLYSRRDFNKLDLNDENNRDQGK